MNLDSSSIIEKSTSNSIEINKKYSKFYDTILKRVIDFSLALFLIVLFLPILFIISFLIKTNSSGPVFYRGIRTGRFGQEFRIFKFRTMIVNAENIGGGTTALNDPRITKVGSFLRKSKLDEIPQLINILLGDMSFIGPRPELPRYTKQYEGNETVILNVRPGITDLSSLEFISLDEVVGSENADEAYEKYVLKRKNELRVEYVLKQSIFMDMKLFFMTVFDVIKKIVKIITGKSGVQNGVQNVKEFRS